MTKRDFHTWLSKFRYSIADFGYYIDFNKVYKNVDLIKIELNILNSLIGSKNIESDFEKLIAKYPETLKCIPILLAVREYEIFAGEKKPSMKRRLSGHDYSDRGIYMITMAVEGRKPLLGTLTGNPSEKEGPNIPHVILSPLGEKVKECWFAIILK